MISEQKRDETKPTLHFAAAESSFSQNNTKIWAKRKDLKNLVRLLGIALLNTRDDESDDRSNYSDNQAPPLAPQSSTVVWSGSAPEEEMVEAKPLCKALKTTGEGCSNERLEASEFCSRRCASNEQARLEKMQRAMDQAENVSAPVPAAKKQVRQKTQGLGQCRF